MHSLRRSVLRLGSAPSSLVLNPTRSITTRSPSLLRAVQPALVSASQVSSPFRRFASNDSDKVDSADRHETSTVQSAINSASETISSAASTVTDALAGNATEGQARRYDNDPLTPPRTPDYGDEPSSGGYGRQRERAPLIDVEPTTTIYVGNLQFDVTSEQLTREFEQFGPVLSASLGSDARGISKGFGYVTFDSVDAAKNAIEAKNRSTFEGRRIIVNYQLKKGASRTGGTNTPSKTLFIGNLAFEMSDADLNKLFREIRNVLDVRVAIDRRTGQPRGFAHADFMDVESATKAFEVLNGREVYGRPLRVDYSAPSRAATRAPRNDDRAGDRNDDQM